MTVRRRTLLAAITTGVLAPALVAPWAAAAEAARTYRVALLGLMKRGSPDAVFFRNALLAGLAAHGYADGRNLVLDVHTADGDPRDLPRLAAAVARQGYDVIVTTTNEVSSAAKAATVKVPIVMALCRDPVGAGLVRSIGRPGGNLTGLTFDSSPEAYAKPLEFLKEISPGLKRVAVLRSSGLLWEPNSAVLAETGRRLAIEIEPIDLRGGVGIDEAFLRMKRNRVGAFLFWPDPVTYHERGRIALAAERDRLPSASLMSQYPESGGLLSYGPNLNDLFRRAAAYVDKILKGANPGDLAIEQPAVFELTINAKVAGALGVTVPVGLLLRADRVIE